MSRAGEVRASGIVAPPAADAADREPRQGQVAVADQVFVPDDGLGALGQPYVLVDGETDGDRAVVMQAEVTDFPDLHPGDANKIARFQAGDVGEDRLIAGAIREAQLAEHRDQREGEDEAHHCEQRDARNDAGQFPSHGGGCPRARSTVAAREGSWSSETNWPTMDYPPTGWSGSHREPHPNRCR